jgi:putative FmdB family regulatory protein
MPTYDYLCESCGNRFDAWQKMSDDPITLCPKCAGHVRRIIHPAGIVFRGSGFYSTDTRGASAAADSGASSSDEATPAPAAASSGEGSTEPAKAAEPVASKATNESNTKAAS